MEFETFIQPAAAWAVQMQSAFIKSGGVFNAVAAVFHLAFPRLFNWQEDLRTLTFENRGIVRMLNQCLSLVLIVFAYVSLLHTEDLLSFGLGLSLMAAIALFWLARALQQVVIFRLRRWSSRLLFLVFLLESLLYGVPAALITWPGPAVP